MKFTDNDYKILKAIIDRNDSMKGLSRIKGTSIKEIMTKTGLSYKKVRDTIRMFMLVGFVDEATMVVRAKTYILTEKGFAELSSLRLNIFGKVDKQ